MEVGRRAGGKERRKMVMCVAALQVIQLAQAKETLGGLKQVHHSPLRPPSLQHGDWQMENAKSAL